MNIQEAKEQIKNSIITYFSKDDMGQYELPLQKQRPVFVMGPPGIGKTAIMEQIASEMGVGLLSYSMTHHTRQSALGLPYIVEKEYEGEKVTVSEYTMSEIISAIYEMKEKTGVKEGILFLDEINCVSETLTPLMLQFLQYKVFGRHQVPEGWIVVTAGNPPEYNQSVREFDIVTWDRLKRIDVEPDFDAWKRYAVQSKVHPAVIAYLETHRNDFYKVESTIEGKRFVTARGWDDLAQMLRLYEKHDLTVDEKVISQYIQDPDIARNFAVYYDLYKKYRVNYQLEEILAGNVSEEMLLKAGRAGFDERLSLVGMIYDIIAGDISQISETDKIMESMMGLIKELKVAIASGTDKVEDILGNEKKRLDAQKLQFEKSGMLTPKKQHEIAVHVSLLEAMKNQIAMETDEKKAFALVQKTIAEKAKQQKVDAAKIKGRLENSIDFTAKAFGQDQEMLVLLTNLTENKESAEFIRKYGSKLYKKYSGELLLTEREHNLELRLKAIDEAANE